MKYRNEEARISEHYREKAENETNGNNSRLSGRVRCLGMDMKKHICERLSDKTICGETVRRRNLTERDEKEYLSCYECTY